ncbi:type I polyketide synthase [Micromonospora sp. S-DT3-3-22]|uniref:type I polyketide synthase n=1 Tax=Micromonospora sp. S-DT3-3-22 TaxID=2755359 RepID=UPI00188F5FA9|nr:type I polyketide synthase [Micromonospora sp. S-DT3-3-22]
MPEKSEELAGQDLVAVVGLACRLPGARSPEEYWELLAAGREAVAEVPVDRAAQVDASIDRAGLIDGVADFDAGFFGVSPREATAMDPRQRLMLELAWEALERAGIDPSAVRGHRAGVFLGAMGDDYAGLVHDQGPGAIDSFTLSALQRGILANRISFFLGLSGPSLVVDSAQSSALVAVYQASESVRRGESAWALAGGVNLILAPQSTAIAGEFGALSPDGRCYTFDARANGYARGEGGGMVVLMRLADAVAYGLDVACVIRGGAVNNDGGGEQLTTPSRSGQEEVLRAALTAAGTDAAEVSYVELHGTGTPVGDRVEAAALSSVFAPRERPLVVGSAKTNIGHLEGAAGIAGLIKATLSVRHAQLPASLNFVTPPDDLPLGEMGIEVATELRAWPGDGPRVAGVSSFGMGGTNCHLVLAQAPDPSPVVGDRPGAAGLIPWLVSGGSPEALRAQAESLDGYVAEPDAPTPLDVGFSLATTRAALTHRAVVIGADAAELRAGLNALATNRPASDVVSGVVVEGGTAFMFTGQGAQRAGMGHELHAGFPVFAESFDAVCAELDPLLGLGLRELVWSGADLLGQTRYTQAALFALETALARLVESYGVRPTHLIGHSIGEITAAHVAGVLSLSDACTLVAARGRLMQAVPSGGVMVAVNAGEDDVRALLSGPGVSIAAVNGSGSVVISGDPGPVLALAEALRAAGVKTRRLRVSHAFHSHHLDGILDEFADAIRALDFRAPLIPVISNLTGRIATTEELTDPAYWARQIRGTVRFADGIRTLHGAGVSRYLELGPDPVLTGMARESLAGPTSVAVSTLRVGQPEARTLLRALGRMHAAGARVDWNTLLAGGRRVALPTYAFQRRRYWIGEARDNSPVAAPAHARDGLLDLVRTHLAAILGYAAADVVPQASFKNLGLTSLTAVELCAGLSGELGLVLPGSLIFDHPTPDRLAAYLESELTGRRDTGDATPLRRPDGDADDPVVVVGMGCRYPGGVGSTADLWELVLSGRDAISGLPRDRGWDLDELFDADPSASGRTYVRHGGFLDDVAAFDAGFFGISPREALAMDPQQRLLLETAWEALEDAGIESGSLRGSSTGVFIGAMPGDYGPPLDNPYGGVDGYVLTGTTGSVVSGRLAYFLGLEGPAVTVDTACSSSLVALHQGVVALRGGDCGLAVVGGVTVMSSPGVLVEFSRQRGLSVDGRCKAFAESADGTGWGEGVGVVVLERLSDARVNGHRVLAVVRGSAVNQDGASNGLTAPNGPSQQRVIRQALAGAGLSGADVDVVEAHGTGTRLGDPIEAQALLETYGREHSADRPLWLGSLKSNIGHTMAAAGIGGVIKMVEAMRRGVLPSTLHVDAPTSFVDWGAGGVRLLTESRPWPETGRPRRAGVSSFGISGTNAHVVLEQAPETEPTPETDLVPGSNSVPGSEKDLASGSGPVGWVVSARSSEALRAYAGRIGAAVESGGSGVEADGGRSLSVVDVAGTLAGRSVFEHRAVVVASTRERLVAGLGAVAGGGGGGGVVTGVAGFGKTVLVFPGQGSQWEAMARELYVGAPVFRSRLEECAEALSVYVEWDLLEVLLTDDGAALLSRVDVVQPALFAVMVSLAALWQSYGLRPEAVVGHSQGEIAAACVIGALSLSDAARVVALRSRAIRVLAGQGGMVSVGLPVEEVRPRLRRWDGDIGVAVINGPGSTVVSGSASALDELQAVFAADDVRTRRVPVDYASHSWHVDRIRDEVLEMLAPIRPQASDVSFYSTVTGQRIDTAGLDAQYWFRNLRSTVEFEATTRSLLADGYGFFVESSAHPVLLPGLQETFDSVGASARGIATLRRDEGDLESFLCSVGEAFVAGALPRWNPPDQDTNRLVTLPTYPFQRTRYWLTADNGRRDVGAVGLTAAGHPLLGAVTEGAASTVFTGRISLSTYPWLADHQVADSIVLPGAAFVELAVHAADRVGCASIRELTVQTPLILPEHGAVRLRVEIEHDTPGEQRAIRIDARPDTGTDLPWTCHATGTLDTQAPTPDWDLTTWPPTGAQPLDISYDTLANNGYHYGPTFQGLHKLWHHNNHTYAEITLPTDPDNYNIHPALLDATLHAGLMSRILPESDLIRLPYSWEGVTLHAGGARTLRVSMTTLGGNALVLRAADGTGTPVIEVRSLAMLPADLGRSAVNRESLLRLEWTPAPSASTAPPAAVVQLGPDVFGLGAASGPGIDPHRITELSELPGGPADVLVCIDGHDGPDVAQTARAVLHRALKLIQEWTSGDRFADARLVVVTRRAVATGDREPVPDLAAAPLWGLLRSAQNENPGRLVLVDVDEDERSLVALPSALAGGATQFALRAGQVLVPRLLRVRSVDRPEAPPRWSTTGTVLITGGTGTLGGLFARHLATKHAVRNLLLVSRRGPNHPGAADLVAELSALGVEVTVAACDVSDRAALAALLDGIPQSRPLAGVVHTAGTLDDGLLSGMTPERLDVVLAPKLDAAWNLHDLTQDLGLSAFVLFSSIMSTIGNAGQGNYAAANGFLDALAQYRHGTGLPATSLAWGFWDERSEMTGDLDAADVARLARTGLRPLPTNEGVALFDAAMTSGVATAVLAAFDLDQLRAQAARASLPEVLRGLVRSRRTASAVTTASTLADQLAGRPAEDVDRELLDLVRSHAATVLGYADAGSVPPGVAFREMGFDSLSALELRKRLSEVAGLRMPATVVFDHPTPSTLAAFLRGQLLGEGAQDGAGVVASPAAATDDDPVVVVGMGCRYPGGVGSAAGLWELVVSGRDAVSGLPRDRGWDLDELFDADPGRTGKSYVDRGYFLDDAGEFDAGFFGISPREALAMHPQQRLLLETAWEALEDAGIESGSLRGTRTGVFIGAMFQDYGPPMHEGSPETDGLLLTGTTGSVVSGRLAYFLGLEGPAVTVDTACSSSLVALHQGVVALRGGDCGLAVVGGVTVMSSPGVLVEFSRQRGLSVDGRCKAFAESADGTGWGEGVGVVVLERLSDARVNGHRVLAVVRGSAVNQDGASNGLTAPNGPSQQRVIRQALAGAGLSGADVDVVEAHGTGTRLGDPIEAQALLETYGREHSADRPLWLGSLKSNIGHTMAAAGIGGVIKMVEAMRRGVLPSTLHVDAPTSFVDWGAGGVRLLTESRPWPETGRPRRAGVSSFGISGTNAHVVLEQAPETEPTPETDLVPGSNSVPGSEKDLASGSGPVGWVVSARSSEALRAYAGRIGAAVESGGSGVEADGGRSLSVVDVAGTLAGRSVFEHRAVVVASTRERLVAGLGAVAGGGGGGGVVTGVAGFGKTVLVFPGQGSQWEAMARELYVGAPVFRSRLEECAEALSVYVEWDLLEVLLTDDGAALLSRVDVVQPALFAVMVSLAALWQSYGLRPEAVVGHSQGEIAAACVIGALSLSDAARVVALRSRAIRVLAGQGGMVSVGLPVEEVRPRLRRWDGDIGVAVINGPGSTVVSGSASALDELQAVFAADDVRTRRVPVDYASHSWHVDRIRDEVLEMLAPIRPQASDVSFYSTVTGQRIDTAGLDAQYWFRNLRSTVEFEATTRSLLADGYGFFVESSAHPVLLPGLQETFDSVGASARGIATLRRDEGDLESFLCSVGEAFVAGALPRWNPPDQDTNRLVTLPTYPFQRTRYWLTADNGRRDVGAVGLTAAGHPLLGAVTEGAASTVFTGRISLSTYPWLADHQVADSIVLPGAAFVELAVHAADRVGCASIRELTVQTPLILPEHGAVRLRVEIEHDTPGEQRAIRIDARPDTGTDLPWTCHATGTLDTQAPTPDWDLTTWPPTGAQPLDISYDTLANNGYHYGPTFQGLHKLWHHNNHTYAEITLPTDPDNYNIHPALLDATLHATNTGGPRLATSWRGVTVYAFGASALRVRISESRTGAMSMMLADTLGDPVAEFTVGTTPVDPGELRAVGAAQLGALYREVWVDHVAKSLPRRSSWAVLGADPLGAVAGLTAAGTPVVAYRDLGELVGGSGDGPDYLVLTVPADAEVAGTACDVAHQLGVLSETEALAATTVVFLTTSAMPAFDPAAADLAGAAVWGLVRAAQADQPGRFVLADLDGTESSWRVLPRAVTFGEPQLALREGRVRVPRLVPSEPTGDLGQPAGAGGTTLITGGDTPMRAWLARHLVAAHGVRRLVLTGTGDPELTADLTARGAEVTVAGCDPGDRRAWRELIHRLPEEHPLRTVVYVPQALPGDGTSSSAPDAVGEALRTTVATAEILDAESGDADLILCSSLAGTVGRPGTTASAASAAALDALARRRRARDASGLSLVWGPWSLGDTSSRTGAGGMGVLGLRDAAALFDAARGGSEAVLVLARLDLAELDRRAKAGEVLPPAFRSLVRSTGKRPAGGGVVSTTSLRKRLASMAEVDRGKTLLGLISAQISAVLGLEPGDAVPPHLMFRELGFDSLSILALRNRLNSTTGVRLDNSSVSHQSTPDDVVQHLRQALLEN